MRVDNAEFVAMKVDSKIRYKLNLKLPSAEMIYDTGIYSLQ